MLRISKILTLNKIHILERLCSTPHGLGVPAVDYFHLGDAIVDPPYIRGSMILQLNRSFLEDNREYFAYGSPIDTGAIRCGFLQPLDREWFLENVNCDHERFSQLVTDLSLLSPPGLASVMQHRRTPEAVDVLKRHFDSRVVDFMMATDEPNAWMFEFGLRKGYRIQAAHIERLFYPNTYSDAPVFQRVRTLIGGRARGFNPRLGIESQ